MGVAGQRNSLRNTSNPQRPGNYTPHKRDSYHAYRRFNLIPTWFRATFQIPEPQTTPQTPQQLHKHLHTQLLFSLHRTSNTQCLRDMKREYSWKIYNVCCNPETGADAHYVRTKFVDEGIYPLYPNSTSQLYDLTMCSEGLLLCIIRYCPQWCCGKAFSPGS